MAKLRMVLMILAVGMGMASAWGTPKIGARLGINWANFNVDPSDADLKWKTRAGTVAGGMVEFPFEVKISRVKIPLRLRTELLYDTKGTHREQNSSGTLFFNDGTETSFRYHEEQLMKVDELVLAPFIVAPIPSGRHTVFAQLGPEVGFNVRHMRDIDGNLTLGSGLSYPTNETVTVPHWRKVNLGLNFGAGIEFPWGGGSGLLDLRYNLGLLNMNTGSDHATVTTQGWHLVFGYYFYPQHPTEE